SLTVSLGLNRREESLKRRVRTCHVLDVVRAVVVDQRDDGGDGEHNKQDHTEYGHDLTMGISDSGYESHQAQRGKRTQDQGLDRKLPTAQIVVRGHGMLAQGSTNLRQGLLPLGLRQAGPNQGLAERTAPGRARYDLSTF